MKLNCFESNWIGILRKRREKKKVVNVNNFDCVKFVSLIALKVSVGEKEKVKKGRGGSKGRKIKRRTKNMNPSRFIIQKRGEKG